MDFCCGVGIENTWIAQVDRPGQRLLDVFLQMGHYERWEEDLALVRDLGVNAIRYSVPWYLSQPEPHRFDWDWIARPLDWLRRFGIVPIVDLIHYGTPTWVDNGVLNHAFPERLSDYAAAFASRFEGVVDHYTPVNEPQTSSSMSGWHGVWPPYLHGADGWLRLCLPMARATVLCTKALRASCPKAVLISADCDFTPPFETVATAAGEQVAPMDEAAQLIHEIFPAALAYGAVSSDHPTAHAALRMGVAEATLDWFKDHRALPDVVGFNYYPDFRTTPLADAAERLYGKLRVLYRILGLPVYISETSAGRSGEEKRLWIGQLDSLCARARAEGLPLRGVNWWPLYETVQWDYRDNGKALEECIVPGGWNNGLYVTGERMQRVATEAVEEYRRFCRRRGGGRGS